MYCDIIYNKLFMSWRHSWNCRYASIKRKISKVLRIKSAKVFWKGVIEGVIKNDDTGDVIKALAFVRIKGCKNCILYQAKYIVKTAIPILININFSQFWIYKYSKFIFWETACCSFISFFLWTMVMLTDISSKRGF